MQIKINMTKEEAKRFTKEVVKSAKKHNLPIKLKEKGPLKRTK